jgi:hypothetical protein
MEVDVQFNANLDVTSSSKLLQPILHRCWMHRTDAVAWIKEVLNFSKDQRWNKGQLTEGMNGKLNLN